MSRAVPATLLASALLLGCVGGGGGVPGGGPTGGGDAPAAEFGLNFNRTTSSAAPTVRGINGLGAAGPIWDEFDRVQDLSGGLARVRVRIDQTSHESAFLRALDAKNRSMDIMLTVVGTPLSLSPSSDTSNPSGAALPVFACFAPTDSVAWANRVITAIDTLNYNYGFLPDYVEIWNEPDIAHYWRSTQTELVDTYLAASRAIKAAYPQVKVGGFGSLATDRSLDETVPLHEELFAAAAAADCAVDFYSWHHYNKPGIAVRYSNCSKELKAAAVAAGLPPIETIVSEWNVHGNSKTNGEDFDNQRAASLVGSFLASAVSSGLDRQCFLALADSAGSGGEAIAAGEMGAFSSYGVAKASARVLQLFSMLAELQTASVDLPEDELAVAIFGSRSGSTGYILIANDPPTAGWAWAASLSRAGFDPLALRAQLETDGLYDQYTLGAVDLLGEGYDAATVDALAGALDASTRASQLSDMARTIEIDIKAPPAQIQSVWRFDVDHNNPVRHNAVVQPAIDIAESDAEAHAVAAAVDMLEGMGVTVTYPLPDLEKALDVAASYGITDEEADAVVTEFATVRREHRSDHAPLLNDLPELRLHAEPPQAAGVTLDGDRLTMTIQPHGVTVIEAAWL